jgi:radical SAM protein with 4Fe4S-binding SPASM domain
VLARLRSLPTCEGLLISLHGPDAPMHEAFSGVPGSFAESVANIRRAVAAGLDVALSTVIYNDNWAHLEATLALARELGVHHLVCNRLLGPPIAGVTPTPAQLREAVATIEALRAAGHPIRYGNCIPQCFTPSASTGCTAGRTFATIDPWGRLRPCNHAPLVAGDVRAESLPALWHGEVMTRWRALVPADCATCAAFATCHGGCRAQALMCNAPHDPLLHAPLPDFAMPADALYLYAGLRPFGRFVLQRAPGESDIAALLVHKGHVVPLPTAWEPLVAAMQGTLTLDEIRAQYGAAALDWVGALYQQGMVTWV